MHLLLKTGIATSGPAFEPGDVVDWGNSEEAQRFIERGFAEEASPEEIKAAGRKAKRYNPRPMPAERPAKTNLAARERGALAKED